MTPPDTNPQKQAKRHRIVLIGMALVALFGVILILTWVGEEAATAPEDQPPPAASQPQSDELDDGDVDVPPQEPEAPAEPEVVPE
ncbi:hypothetical protein [Mangrovicoccus algicola]|uniref:Uncharacterized protein n=1 Tax=Mangrovicoccus algicola TaxID=2771008 RepID=A0A8J6YX34_9RHOB|nr:hypothetical protein [Mangrovicoccus algicola]MBE3637628.1 hypothetical protein [Mangrovicoccus algicola]